MLRFMLRSITPRVPKDGVQSFTPEEVAELTKQQNAFLDRDTVGSVNGAPLATFADTSSGFTFVHTHPLPSDKNMVDKEEDIDATRTTDVMVGEDGKLVETARVTLRVHEDITGQTKFKPNQGNTYEFSRLNKKQYAEATGDKKFRGQPDAAKIVADTGGHVAIKAQLRNEKVGDIVFVGKDARTQLLDVIAREMSDLKIILFGESTAQLAFPGMGMNAFSWMKPESMAFGIMFCETTGVWRNFMCVHGYGTLNGYTSISQGEKGMANNMRVLVRIADWFHYMYMEPICDNFMHSAIFRRHMEAMVEYAVEEENKIQHCFANNERYFSPPLLMSIKGGEKSAEARRALPATGQYAGVMMKNGEECKNALQEGGKEMAEARRALPATGEYAGVMMKNGEECKNALQEAGKETAEARRALPATGEYAGARLAGGGTVGNQLQASGKHSAEKLRGKRATGEYAGARLAGGGTVGNQLQQAGKEMAETLRGKRATGEYAGARLAGGGTVGNQLQQAGKKLSVEYGSLGTRRTKPWVTVRASRIMNGEDHEFAVFDGSLWTTVNNGVASATVLIQSLGHNKEKYKQMLDKYDQDKQNFKNAVDLPASTLRLSFDTDTKLEDIVKSLADCAPNKPVPVFRRDKGRNALAPDQAINWKFEVIGYLPAETRKAEMVAAAAERAKIH